MRYEDIKAINASSLKQLYASPLHYREYVQGRRKEETPAMRLGRAIHAATLEPDAFARDFTVFATRKAGKAWQEFKADHGDKTILSLDEFDTAERVAGAVSSHPAASELLKDGEAEKPLTWTDDRTGLECKGRLDFLGAPIVDLKSVHRLKPERNLGAWLCDEDTLIHMQLAFYQDGVEAVGLGKRPVIVLAVESKPPFDVAVIPVSDRVLRAGRRLYSRLIDKLIECRESDSWPGRYPEPVEVELPAWAPGAERKQLTMKGEAI